MSTVYHAGYAVDPSIFNLMSTFGTFCLVLMLFLISGWGVFTSILPRLREDQFSSIKELRAIVILVLLILLIGMAIVGNYIVQRVSLSPF
jgi:peptidoglycan/LPS O-acetylase OafA/YrhL